MNYRQLYAIKKANKERLIKHFGNIPQCAGIYILTRTEDDKKYAYIGQSISLLDRLESHLTGFKQRIDLSLKTNARGLYNANNKGGWQLQWIVTNKLDEVEKNYIALYERKGFELYNKTGGGQGKGKEKINEYKPPKTYTQGKAYGKKQLAKELKHIIDNYLIISLKKDNKISNKMLEKFNKLIDIN